MKLILTLALSIFVSSGCVHTEKTRGYVLEDRRYGVEEDGVTWNLKIESHRKDLGIVFVFWNRSNGPPYAVNFTPFGERLGESVRVTKLEVTMPGGTVYDVLHGQTVELPVRDLGPRQARYKSGELPLKFKVGRKISIELHCQTDGTDFVVRRNFVGRERRTTQSLVNAMGSI
jgi:hypothetical protein